MGGDHGHHGHHHHGPPKLPDWRSYKVEEIPELMRVKESLAFKGLKDPWLRNEVWRYQPQHWGTVNGRLRSVFLRGFKWGVAAFVATIAIESGLEAMKPPTEHGHGHGHGHH